MGITSSRIDDAAPIFLRDQYRLSIKSLQIVNAQGRVLLNISPNAFPCTRFVARREPGDEAPVDYIQDSDPFAVNNSPIFILKLLNDESLTLNFTFVIRQPPQQPQQPSLDTAINGLTFIFGSSHKELENLVTREFHADPNLHKNSNVALVGDFSTSGNQSVEFDWSWIWRPPKLAEVKGGGWRTSCGLVEYDQRAHRLNTLAEFSFWVQAQPSMSPSLAPTYGLLAPPRIRVASNRSTISKLSSNEGEPDIPEDAVLDNAVLSPATLFNEPKYEPSLNRPGDNFNVGEDGPLFRATMKAFEQKTGNMRSNMKRVLRKAEAARQAQIECNVAVAGFIESLQDASVSNPNVLQPALESYFDKTARAILRYEQTTEKNLQKLVIDPINKLYNVDIKQAETKKRDFEEESRDYYAYVSRYLGQRSDSLKGKKRTESDTKYQNKTKEFELKRFDYNSFMQDLHGGRKEQEILSQLTMYADAQARNFLDTAEMVKEYMPQLEALNKEVKEADKEFKWKRTEREEKRRALEKSSTPYGEPDVAPPLPSPTIGNHASDSESARDVVSSLKRTISNAGSRQDKTPASSAPNNTSNPAAAGQPPVAPSPDRFKGYRDIQEHDGSRERGLSEIERRKEGLLWALSRPGSHADPKGLNKQAWHKYWIVLAGGKLSEYSNWKQRLDLHNDPIDLRLASVREARNSDRRFCFEVITPQYKRVYQATSEEDMQSWIKSISFALKTTLEGAGSNPSFDTSTIADSGSMKKDIGSVLTGKSPSSHYYGLSHHSSTSSTNTSATNSSSVYRRTTVGSRPNVPLPASFSSPSQLLTTLRAQDESNKTCADCGSSDKVDWVSINLGVILCIECGGIHRSLGTHISKVRSLTLDTTSFTSDIVALLLAIGNKLANSVWEASLPEDVKPVANSTREQRLKYATAKYVARCYLKPLPGTGSPEDALLTAVKTKDLGGVLAAIAAKADMNARDRSKDTHVVFLALAATDPAMPSSMPPPPLPHSASSSSISGGDGKNEKAFPLPELLLQNGSDLPSLPAPIQLSFLAESWVKAKLAKRVAGAGAGAGAGGTAGVTGGGGSGGSSGNNGGMSHMSDGVEEKSDVPPPGKRSSVVHRFRGS